MKKLITLCLTLPLAMSAQTYTNIATDKTGDDYAFGLDSKALGFRLNSTNDTLFVKVDHHNTRHKDFGYALALDTNNNPTDGAAIPQANLASQTPNTSMKADIMLYAYQNSIFPTVYTESYVNGSPANIMFTLDTNSNVYGIFAIPVSEIGSSPVINMLAFTGSFDISPAGAGPSDVMPDSNYGSAIPASVSLAELKHDMSIFPNPATNSIELNYNGAIQIVDVSGKVWLNPISRQNEAVDVSHLPPGSYLLLDDSGIKLGQFQKK
ncbi:T9SS type A sorting domain-containing protein [Owenweeksia hongkongensis]|uniref:T9SS type A sorting domain-containing protein n=1 Tax=Owenweeksia hongkongensis TaxID=253245 RepID=UPI003A955826